MLNHGERDLFRTGYYALWLLILSFAFAPDQHENDLSSHPYLAALTDEQRVVLFDLQVGLVRLTVKAHASDSIHVDENQHRVVNLCEILRLFSSSNFPSTVFRLFST